MNKISKIFITLAVVGSLSLAALPVSAASTNDDIISATGTINSASATYGSDLSSASDSATISSATATFQAALSSAKSQFQSAANAATNDQLKIMPVNSPHWPIS